MNNWCFAICNRSTCTVTDIMWHKLCLINLQFCIFCTSFSMPNVLSNPAIIGTRLVFHKHIYFFKLIWLRSLNCWKWSVPFLYSDPGDHTLHLSRLQSLHRTAFCLRNTMTILLQKMFEIEKKLSPGKSFLYKNYTSNLFTSHSLSENEVGNWKWRQDSEK